MFFNQNREPLILQEYLKDVRNGDKRIILLNGEIVGAINRVPQKEKVGQTCMLVGKPKKLF
jgi:glutathione synthase